VFVVGGVNDEGHHLCMLLSVRLQETTFYVLLLYRILTVGVCHIRDTGTYIIRLTVRSYL